MTSPRVQGRVLAWTALIVALSASVAANVAYARSGWGPRLSAAVAPLLVVLAAGLLERASLTGARWWQRWLAIGGLIFVVAAAFVTSFQHQRSLLLEYGNPALSAVLLPFAVDALVIMSSVCLAVIGERRRAAAVLEVGEKRELDDRFVRVAVREDIARATSAGPVAEVPRPARRKPAAAERRGSSGRRPVAEARKLAEELLGTGLERPEVAARLGVSERRLRQVLAAEVPATA